MARAAQLLWHYALWDRYRAILGAGELRASLACVDRSEPALVWFSTNGAWDPLAGASAPDASGGRRVLTLREAYEVGGVYRIGVVAEAAPIRWADFVTMPGVTEARVRGLRRLAAVAGSEPRRWRASPVSVPRARWAVVERLDDGRWRRLEPAEPRPLVTAGA